MGLLYPWLIVTLYTVYVLYNQNVTCISSKERQQKTKTYSDHQVQKQLYKTAVKPNTRVYHTCSNLKYTLFPRIVKLLNFENIDSMNNPETTYMFI